MKTRKKYATIVSFNSTYSQKEGVMKKLAILLLSAICLTAMSGCGYVTKLIWGSNELTHPGKEVVEKYLGVDLSTGQVLDDWEERGFFNDGTAFVKMSVPDGFETDLGLVEVAEGKFGDGWYALPLTGTAYEYFYEWGGLFEHPETKERVIPEIENGYWKMLGSEQNWEMVILDTDADVLYYYEYDS